MLPQNFHFLFPHTFVFYYVPQQMSFMLYKKVRGTVPRSKELLSKSDTGKITWCKSQMCCQNFPHTPP